MCGITGWVDFNKELSQYTKVLEEMNQTLAVRGPDAKGIWVSKHVALAHRRLIIIDPVGGAQPMMKQMGDQRLIITYNGEIYNFQELRTDLCERGYQFDTRSDTEVILAAYTEWGEDCPKYLNGIFAFAIWDEAKQKLFLARDRMGVKPLFYATKGSSFLFGSEMKALLAHPEIEPVIDEEGIAEILMMGPARTPGCGIFRDIAECKPGHLMRVDRTGIYTSSYWELVSREHTDDLETTVETVRKLFFQAVKRQLVSDVPVGTMLSGGLDSSAISACANQVFQDEGRHPLMTYSIDYEGNNHYFQKNEFQPQADAPWVQRMVEYLSSNHQVVMLDMPDLIGALPQALIARDVPGMTDIDASLLLFCQAIKQRSTVVLSGECADEIFGGYPWFHRPELVGADTFPWARLAEKRIPFIRSTIVDQINPLHYLEEKYQAALAEVPRLSEESAVEARMRELFYLNLTRWMPTLLDRKDRMSMACGLEVRVPFCDHDLIEYVWNIPWSMKSYGEREKGLLRKALEGILPDEVLFRKKSPFPKTHHPLYLQTMKKQLMQVINQPEAPLFQLLDRQAISHFLQQDLSKVHLPWFGQLMNVPQLLAYFVQLNQWLSDYKVQVKQS